MAEPASGLYINRSALADWWDVHARFLFVEDDQRLREFARDAIARTSTRADEYATIWTSRYGLTETETLLLVAAASGTPQKASANDQGIAHGTLKRHVQNLLKKTGGPSLLAAAARMLRERLDDTARR